MLYKIFVGVTMAVSLNVYFCRASAADTTRGQEIALSIPIKLRNQTFNIIKLREGEKIELDKSIAWSVAGHEYYFLSITLRQNQACRFLFVDATLSKSYEEESDFEYDRCAVIKPPQILDINKDGYADFRVHVKIPHQFGSPALVNHYFNFIYNPQLQMFCEQDRHIPCSYFQKK